MDEDTVELLKAVGSRASALLFSRYVTAIAAGILIYDHLLNLDSEIRFMWRSSKEAWPSRLIYFFTRYPTEGIILFLAYFIGGAHATSVESYVWVFATVAASVLVCMEVSVVLRMYDLWEGRRLLTRILGVAFFVDAAAVLVMAVLTARQLAHDIVYIPVVNSCYGGGRSADVLPGLFGCMVFFDLIVLALSIINALEIPRNKHSDFVISLFRDGWKIFAGIFLLRTCALILSIIGRVSVIYVLLPLLYCLISIVHCRLTLRVAESKCHDASETLPLDQPPPNTNADRRQNRPVTLRPTPSLRRKISIRDQRDSEPDFEMMETKLRPDSPPSSEGHGNHGPTSQIPSLTYNMELL